MGWRQIGAGVVAFGMLAFAPSAMATDGGAIPGCSAIQFVNAVPGVSSQQVQRLGNAQSWTLPDAGTGDLLVAIAYGGQGVECTGSGPCPPSTAPNMTFSVSDTAANAYFPGPMFENPQHHQASMQIFYAAGIDGGSVTVTVVTDAGVHSPLPLYTGLLLQEYAGVATQSVVDVSSGQSAPAASLLMTPGTMKTPNDCDLVVAAFADGNVPGQGMDAGTGWVYRSTDRDCPAGAVDNAPDGGAQGTDVDAQMLLTSQADDGWVAAQMAFRPATTAAQAQPSELAFVTPPQTVAANACSGVVTVQSQSSGGTPLDSSTGIDLNASAQGGLLFVDAACQYPLVRLLIGAGTSSTTFYFRGACGGPLPIFVSAAAFGPIKQTEIVSDAGSCSNTPDAGVDGGAVGDAGVSTANLGCGCELGGGSACGALAALALLASSTAATRRRSSGRAPGC